MTGEEIITRIKQRRLELGLTLAQLSKTVFNDERQQAYLSKIENGQKDIKISTMLKILNALDIETSLNVTGEGYKEEEPVVIFPKKEPIVKIKFKMPKEPKKVEPEQPKLDPKDWFKQLQ